jgi:hypothetical protein
MEIVWVSSCQARRQLFPAVPSATAAWQSFLGLFFPGLFPSVIVSPGTAPDAPGCESAPILLEYCDVSPQHV